jgi:hypothetical protein
MKPKSTLLTFGALLGVSILTGCTTTQPQQQPKPTMNEVSFEQSTGAVPLFRIKNRNDVKEVITFARSLSNADRYSEAADIYLDAAERFKSASGNFEIDCQMAAVREYWLAGELVKASTLLDRLEKEQDIYNRAGESEDIRRLRNLLHESSVIKQQLAKSK